MITNDLLARLLALANRLYGEPAGQINHDHTPCLDRPESPYESTCPANQSDLWVPAVATPIAGYARPAELTPSTPDAAVTPDTAPSESVVTYQREAQLDYQLDLRFDLAALTRTAASLSEGGAASVEELAAAGFGLSVGFDLSGRQVQQIAAEDSAVDVSSVKQRTGDWSRQTAAFAVQGREFGLQAASRQALKIRRKLDVNVHGNHQRAVNRFSLRYRLDNRLSVSQFERFNVQTEQMAHAMPDDVGRYLDTAGELATDGSTAMLTGFFDAVDAYLNQTEQDLQRNVGDFLSSAAVELGFSEEVTAMVENHLASSIDGFFDRVDNALAVLRTEFDAGATTPATTGSDATVAESVDGGPTVLSDLDGLARLAEYTATA